MSKTIIIALPKGATNVILLRKEIAFYVGNRKQYIDLPPGSWSILATTEQVLQDEELARQCVLYGELKSPSTGENIDSGYKNYEGLFSWFFHDKATDSFRSLLESLAIEQGVVLIQNQNQ